MKWNPWHGCHKISAGCMHCYMYRIDARHGRDSSLVSRTSAFALPVRRNRRREYAIPSGHVVYTCFSSDFFVKEADAWRAEAWKMIAERRDLHFFMITKRIHRFYEKLPSDWGDGYEHVTICCTMENQAMADYRMPLYKEAPIKHKIVVCEPLLGRIDFRSELGTWLESVSVGGESGPDARLCHYEWILDIRRQCLEKEVPFTFRQTGAKLLKEGKVYSIRRQIQHSQARKAGIDWGNHVKTPTGTTRHFQDPGISQLKLF